MSRQTTTTFFLNTTLLSTTLYSHKINYLHSKYSLLHSLPFQTFVKQIKETNRIRPQTTRNNHFKESKTSTRIRRNHSQFKNLNRQIMWGKQRIIRIKQESSKTNQRQKLAHRNITRKNSKWKRSEWHPLNHNNHWKPQIHWNAYKMARRKTPSQQHSPSINKKHIHIPRLNQPSHRNHLKNNEWPLRITPFNNSFKNNTQRRPH